MRKNERAVSITVGYVLNVAVAALLMSGLLIAGGGLIESQTKQVTTDELAVIGQQLADDLSSADRLVRAGDVSSLSIRIELPDRTAAGGYTVDIRTSDDDVIELRTNAPEVIVTVPLRLNTSVRDGGVGGGPIQIDYETDADRLVVNSA